MLAKLLGLPATCAIVTLTLFSEEDSLFNGSRRRLCVIGPVYVSVKKIKERIVLREIHLRTTRRHLSNGITQCYLLPDRGGRPAVCVFLSRITAEVGLISGCH